MSHNILLRNGSVIIHDDNDHVQVLDNCDVLISNGFIEQVGKDISSVKDTDVLDCTDKIISPGFVDTHHHLWQTQLKGYGLDNTWLDYFSDAEAAITAFSDSGIRGVFAYAETFLNLAKWDSQSIIPQPTSVSDTYIQHLELLAKKGPSVPQVLERYSLFPKPDDDHTIVLSHGNYLDKTDLTMLSQRQVPLSCTPATEAQGSMGWPLLFEPGLNTSLGADCHFLNSSSLMQAARNALLLVRLQKTLELKSKGRKLVKFDQTTYDVFNKATIQGARAVGMQDQIGSIQVGKRADIIVFTRTSSLSFGTATRENPVAAIVGYSEPRDTEAVLVGGVFRKREGRLLPITRNGETTGLDSIMSEVQRSQAAIMKRRETCNLGLSRDLVEQIATPR
ncbi:hypothetical protein ACHAO7_010996 [Fusarium culmorum]